MQLSWQLPCFDLRQGRDCWLRMSMEPLTTLNQNQRLTSYRTPTVGLGCNSGGYLLYGVLATWSWMLLLSAYLFHLHASNASNASNNRVSAWWYTPLAAMTCYTGKLTARISPLWIFYMSIFQFTNLYNTCSCYTSILSLRNLA
jgi:hypothetical protein